MAHTADGAVLGIPVHLECDSQALLRAAAPALRCADVAPAAVGQAPLHVALTTRHMAFDPDEAMRFELEEPHVLRIHSPSLEARADDRTGRATLALGVDPGGMIVDVLDALLLFLATARDRVPLHAAAVAQDDAALLLSGSSGTGKSTLAYALMREGARVLADDAVYIQRDPQPGVWSAARPLQLLPHLADRFPELTAYPATVQSNGKLKRRVPLQSDSCEPVRRAGLCLLSRGDDVAVERIDPQEAVAEVTMHVDPGFDRYADDIRAVAPLVAQRGCWRLTLSREPGDALPHIRRMLESISD